MDLSGSSLAAALLVSGVGTGLFLYGNRQSRLPQLLAGLALMVYPMFASGWLTILVIAAAVIGGLWVGIRAGMY